MQSYDFGKAFASWYGFKSKLSFNSFQTKNLHEEKKIDKKQTLEQMFTQECTQVITQVITQISLSLHVKYSNVRRTNNLGFLTATSK